MADGVYTAQHARARAAAEDGIERLVEEMDVAVALDLMANAGAYHGEWCRTCRCDVIPMPDGRCGWCSTLVADPA